MPNDRNHPEHRVVPLSRLLTRDATCNQRRPRGCHATIVSRERRIAGSALIGAAWGVGHTITIMAVGAAIIVFGVVIPPRLGLSMEFAVGIMLVLLGVLKRFEARTPRKSAGRLTVGSSPKGAMVSCVM